MLLINSIVLGSSWFDYIETHQKVET
uniref:Uncharacterized protein n=1 Tax=Rhizophora mucronata TaxID=61149 RepID=A0A2P2QX58_RHIMU